MTRLGKKLLRGKENDPLETMLIRAFYYILISVVVF